MIEARFEHTLAVTAQDKAAMQRLLTIAERLLRLRAMTLPKRGILITRHSPELFTVALSGDVPYGLTRECHFRQPGLRDSDA